MRNDRSLRYLKQGISRGLSADYFAEQKLPEQLKDLLNRLSLLDGRVDAVKTPANEGPSSNTVATPREELNCYLNRVSQYLPAWLSRAVQWLREPDRIIARIAASLLLIAGGFFSFLPVLGIWMLPLGLIIISQDLPFLQVPLVRTLAWTEQRWHTFLEWWRR